MIRARSLICITALTAMVCAGTFGISGCSPQQNSGDANQGSAVKVKSQEGFSPLDTNISIEETTLIDIPEVAVVANSLTFKNDNAYVEITATNKTDTKISINAGTLGYSGNFINNYMVTSGYLGLELEPQETKSDELYFSGDELHLLGIDKIGEIGIGLDVGYNEFGTGSTEMNLDDIAKDIVSIRTSAYDSVDMGADTYQDSINNDLVLSATGASLLAFDGNGGFDQSGISIKSVSLVRNKDDNVTVFVEIRNDTDAIVSATAGDISVNGAMAYEGLWTSETIAPGKTAIMDVSLNSVTDSISDQIDLNDISSVGLDFGASDAQSNTIVAPVELEFSF